MTTSIIIPTKNEIDAIKKILPQVNLDWADEWILIDGNSTDGTVEEAEKLGFKAIRQKEMDLVMHIGRQSVMLHVKISYFLVQMEMLSQNIFLN